VRVFNPAARADGFESAHTLVLTVTDDMPFLVDSVTMELNREGYAINLVIHPVMGIRRHDHGQRHHDDPADPVERPERQHHAQQREHIVIIFGYIVLTRGFGGSTRGGQVACIEVCEGETSVAITLVTWAVDFLSKLQAFCYVFYGFVVLRFIN